MTFMKNLRTRIRNDA